MREKLTVHRKAYTRKAYTRASGVHVKAARVPATTLEIEDRGAVGRGKKLFKVHKGLLTKYGYHVANPENRRHDALKKADKQYGSVKLWRMLNAQVLFRKREPSDAAATFRQDRDWIKKNLINRKEAASMTKPAVRKWEHMSHAARVRARAK
jgi:hypothetical protein